jgi:hypothetical protein
MDRSQSHGYEPIPIQIPDLSPLPEDRVIVANRDEILAATSLVRSFQDMTIVIDYLTDAAQMSLYITVINNQNFQPSLVLSLPHTRASTMANNSESDASSNDTMQDGPKLSISVENSGLSCDISAHVWQSHPRDEMYYCDTIIILVRDLDTARPVSLTCINSWMAFSSRYLDSPFLNLRYFRICSQFLLPKAQ